MEKSWYSWFSCFLYVFPWLSLLGKTKKNYEKFAGCSVAEPIGVLDLGYGSLVDSIDPPLPPPAGHRGPKVWLSELAVEPWAVHFSINFSLRFWTRFWTRFGSVLGSSWAPFGPIWEPKLGQVGPKMHLEVVFFRKRRCSRNIGKRKAKTTFLIPRRAQDRFKTSPKRLQER